LIDHTLAAEAYEKAAALPKAMTYLRRFAAYEIAKAPGREAEAYRKLRALYDEGERQRMPTLVHLLGQLEEKLAVPHAQRAYIEQTASEASKPPVVR
jgi:predicted TPR repeat methyltransferase